MADFNAVARKKILNVPVIYWVAAFVVVLAIVAYRMKPSPGSDTTTSGDGTGTDQTGGDSSNPYASLGSNGTVTVVQGTQSTDAGSNAAYKSNDEWVRAGASWLATNKNVSGSTALSVLNKYVSGDYSSLSTAEKQMVDDWFAQAGPPPDNVTAPTQDAPATGITTNAQWISQGSSWLVANEHATGSAALAALTKYVNGQDRSYAEQQWVDEWFNHAGAPPEGVTATGVVGAKPPTAAQRQFTTFPGVHVIRGGADNGYTGLAKLYYNSTAADRIDLLQAANTNIGPSGPWPIGTRVVIPAYHAPQYYTVPVSGMTEAQICSKNGITKQQFEVLNNGYKSSYSKGARVRVH